MSLQGAAFRGPPFFSASCSPPIPPMRPTFLLLSSLLPASFVLVAELEPKAQFEAKLRDDPAFAASAGQRLEFFYRRHPSWDQRSLLYPVLRTAGAP